MKKRKERVNNCTVCGLRLPVTGSEAAVPLRSVATPYIGMRLRKSDVTRSFISIYPRDLYPKIEFAAVRTVAVIVS